VVKDAGSASHFQGISAPVDFFALALVQAMSSRKQQMQPNPNPTFVHL